MNRSCRRLLLFALTVLGFAAHAGTQSGGGPYRMESSVIAAGGSPSSGGAFLLRGTFGQSATATLSASSYRFYGGFWAAAAGSAPTDLIFANGFDP
jgi:hypothetical protein